MNETCNPDSIYSKRKDLMGEWDWETNKSKGIDPKKVTLGSNKRASWVCSKCGYVWETIVNKRALKNTGCPVCAGRVVVAGQNDLQSNQAELMREWDWETNELEGIKPSEVTQRSNKRANWVCYYGHKWKAVIANRVGSNNRKGNNCPHCSCAGTSYPEQFMYYLIKQTYEDTINGGKTANNVEYDIVIPSHKVAIEYNGTMFHVDSHKEKRIRKVKENLCKLNNVRFIEIFDNNIEINGITTHENKIYFRHTKDKEEEQLVNIIKIINKKLALDIIVDSENVQKARIMAIKVMKKDIVTNSLSEYGGIIASEFNSEKNGVKADRVTIGTTKRYFWKCSKCNHEWKTGVASRILNGTGCPACSGRVATRGKNDFLTVHPKLALDWSKSNKLAPSEYTKCSGKRVIWECHVCGHEWESTISNRVSRNKKCPKCKHITL